MDTDKKRQQWREWYARNREAYNLSTKEAKTKRKQDLYEWFAEYKRTLKCCECGFSDYRALQFHHTDRKTKINNVSNIVRGGSSKEKILLEISKCIVLCANCHMIFHYRKVA